MRGWSVLCALLSCVCCSLQTNNVLGASRGLHKECGCQLALLSLLPQERFLQENILLPMVSRACVYKKYGMGRVVSGIDEDGTRHLDEPNYAADMREADEGRWIDIPDDINGGTRTVRLRLWQLPVGADMLGSNSCTPFQESPSAHVLCRQCKLDRSKPGAYRAFSFHRQETDGVYVPERRTWPELRAILKKCRDPTTKAAERKRIMAAEGIKRLYFAMDPDLVPHVNPCEDHLQDGLHLFGDGLLRSHCAWMFHPLEKLGLDLKDVNAAIRRYNRFPKDVRIPPLHAGQSASPIGGQILTLALNLTLELTLNPKPLRRSDEGLRWRSWDLAAVRGCSADVGRRSTSLLVAQVDSPIPYHTIPYHIIPYGVPYHSPTLAQPLSMPYYTIPQPCDHHAVAHRCHAATPGVDFVAEARRALQRVRAARADPGRHRGAGRPAAGVHGAV